MYHVQGTHVTPDMNPEQAARAARWEKPAMLVSLLVLPYLLLNFYTTDGVDNTLVDVLYFVIWGFFVAEAVWMLRLAPDNLGWVKRNLLDIIILVVTAPVEFLPDGFEALQALWVLRILDLAPLIHRYVFRMTVLRYALILWVLTVFAGGLMYGIWERTVEGGPANLLDATYWANTVVSTVGFGDLLPHLWYTKLLAMGLQLMGPILAAILVAGILPLFDREFAEGFSDRMARKLGQIAEDVDEIEEDIEDIESDIDAIAHGEAAQDRVLAEIARAQQEIMSRLDAAGIAPAEKRSTSQDKIEQAADAVDPESE